MYLTGVGVVYLPDYCCSLVCVQNIPDEPPKCAFLVASRMHRCVRVRLSKSRGLSKLSRGFPVGSSPRRLPRHVPGPWSVISWTCLSRARPSLWHAPWLPLLLSILQWCFRSTAGGSNPLSSLLYRCRGYTLNPSQFGLVCLSVYLTDPSLAGTPRSVASDGSPPVYLHHDPH